MTISQERAIKNDPASALALIHNLNEKNQSLTTQLEASKKREKELSDLLMECAESWGDFIPSRGKARSSVTKLKAFAAEQALTGSEPIQCVSYFAFNDTRISLCLFEDTQSDSPKEKEE